MCYIKPFFNRNLKLKLFPLNRAPVRRGRQLPVRPRRRLRVQGQRGGHEVRRLQVRHLRPLQGQPGRLLPLLLLRQGRDVRAGQLGLDSGQIKIFVVNLLRISFSYLFTSCTG